MSSVPHLRANAPFMVFIHKLVHTDRTFTPRIRRRGCINRNKMNRPYWNTLVKETHNVPKKADCGTPFIQIYQSTMHDLRNKIHFHSLSYRMTYLFVLSYVFITSYFGRRFVITDLVRLLLKLYLTWPIVITYKLTYSRKSWQFNALIYYHRCNLGLQVVAVYLRRFVPWNWKYPSIFCNFPFRIENRR